MRKLKTIVETENLRFDKEVNEYLKKGYKVLHASSSSFDGEYTTSMTLIAVLYFDEV